MLAMAFPKSHSTSVLLLYQFLSFLYISDNLHHIFNWSLFVERTIYIPYIYGSVDYESLINYANDLRTTTVYPSSPFLSSPTRQDAQSRFPFSLSLSSLVLRAKRHSS